MGETAPDSKACVPSTASSGESSLSSNPGWSSLLWPHSLHCVNHPLGSLRALSPSKTESSPYRPQACSSCPSLFNSNYHKAWSSARCLHPSGDIPGTWLSWMTSTSKMEGTEKKERQGLKAQQLGRAACSRPSPALGALCHSIPLQISYTQLSPSPPQCPSD